MTKQKKYTIIHNDPTIEITSHKATTIAVLGDIHFPYEDPTALRLTRTILDHTCPDILILNGDIMDFFGISKFPVPPTRRIHFSDELHEAAAKLQRLRSWYPKIPAIYLEGNHEQRLQRYLWSHSPELSELVTVNRELNLQDLDIQYLSAHHEPKLRHEFSTPHVKVDKLYITHGHGVRLSGSVINVARTLFLRMLRPMLVGHFHRKDIYLQTDYEGKISGTFTQGCLCRPRPYWDSGRIWGQGLSIVTAYDGSFEVDVLDFIPRDDRLICHWRGKRFSAPIRSLTWK